MVGTTRTSCSADEGYLRKIRKPLVEKKRRDRMNRSIETLKMLIADSLVDVTSSKLDKADILDLTVSHLQRLKHQQASVSMATEASSYSSGFKDCAKETICYLSSTRAVTPESLGNLSNHLHTVYVKKAERQSEEQAAVASRAFSPPVQTSPQYCSTPVQGLHSVLNTSTYSDTNSVSDSSMYSQLSGPVYSVMDLSRASRCRRVSSQSSGSSDTYSYTTDVSADSALGISSASDIVLEDIIKEETPWRPW